MAQHHSLPAPTLAPHVVCSWGSSCCGRPLPPLWVCHVAQGTKPGPGVVSPCLWDPTLHLCTRWGDGRGAARSVCGENLDLDAACTFICCASSLCFENHRLLIVSFVTDTRASDLLSKTFAERLLQVSRGLSREGIQVCGTLALAGGPERHGERGHGVCAQGK